MRHQLWIGGRLEPHLVFTRAPLGARGLHSNVVLVVETVLGKKAGYLPTLFRLGGITRCWCVDNVLSEMKLVTQTAQCDCGHGVQRPHKIGVSPRYRFRDEEATKSIIQQP
jgi:hypothetical protein